MFGQIVQKQRRMRENPAVDFVISNFFKNYYTKLAAESVLWNDTCSIYCPSSWDIGLNCAIVVWYCPRSVDKLKDKYYSRSQSLGNVTYCLNTNSSYIQNYTTSRTHTKWQDAVAVEKSLLDFQQTPICLETYRYVQQLRIIVTNNCNNRSKHYY